MIDEIASATRRRACSVTVSVTPSSGASGVARRRGRGSARRRARSAAPLSRAAVAAFMCCGLASTKPGAGSSSAKPKRTSLAVVTAAWPPQSSAMRRARSLAPWWPPSSGTAEEPSSATAITGGSLRLSLRCGAMARIRMPAAQRPMMRAALAEQLAQMGRGLGIGDVAAGHAVRRVDFGAERRLQLPRQRQGGGAEHEEDGLHHASVPA